MGGGTLRAPQTSTRARGPARLVFHFGLPQRPNPALSPAKKLLHDPPWVWVSPWYRSIGVLRISSHRTGLFSHLVGPPARPVKLVPLWGCCVALPGCPRSLNAKRPVPPGRLGTSGALGCVSVVLWVVWTTLMVLESRRGRRRQLRDAAASQAFLRRRPPSSDSRPVSWVSVAPLRLEFEYILDSLGCRRGNCRGRARFGC